MQKNNKILKKSLVFSIHPRFLKRVRDEPFCQGLGAELRDVLWGGEGLAWEDEGIKLGGGRDGLEHFVDVLIGQRVLASGCPSVVVLLTLGSPSENEEIEWADPF